MRHAKLISLIAAIVLILCLAAASLASEGTLSALWNSGCDLLFHTDNVTVAGEATFYLEGERFKTAKLNYIQDGFRSFYQLDLETPREYGTDMKSGWTIIADEDGYIYVMEVRKPGTYISGFDDALGDSLLRRSVELDALTELAGLMADALEAQLPEGAVTAQDSTVHIALSQDQIPVLARSAANLGFSYLCDRWFSYGHDRSVFEEESVTFDGYDTPTKALANGTVYWALRGVDMECKTDGQGRLTDVKGSMQVASTFRSGEVREVEVEFTLAMTKYGESAVAPFDPDEYDVVPYTGEYWDLYENYAYESQISEPEWEAWRDKTVAELTALGYDIPDDTDWSGWIAWNGMICVELYPAEGVEYYCDFSENGDLWAMGHSSNWLYAEETEVEGVSDETIAEARALALSLLAERNPELAEMAEDLAVEGMMATENGGKFLSFSCGEESPLYFVIQIEPSLRIDYFTGENNG